MNKTINIRIGIGAMCDSIHKQLNKQGVQVTKPEVDHFQRAHDGFVQLRVLGCMGDKEADRIGLRLSSRISKFCEQKLKQQPADNVETRTPIQALLDFIVSQDFESLEEYPSLESPLREQYSIVNKATNKPDVIGLINEICRWENSPTSDSLETVLKQKFLIEIR